VAVDPGSRELEEFRRGDQGRPLVMFQILRFSEGGRERYLQYAAAAQPILMKLGAQILYAGEAGAPLVGEAWDGIVVTRYPSRSAFLQLLADSEYQALSAQRRAALREAVMLPMDDWPGR